ncbi:sulfotransferase domain-containing protein [uncultured Parasphingorhabdus sp.]|uniref:sulfotransferase domain-containing protein n=1 Tax=uncultured Parasphingorhabdus sp. TaxID=2709694 RepID=UPI002AA6201F|nr:sulfotransferase domain-containing protein [uncultured Parasphingorhabdus sp.]
MSKDLVFIASGGRTGTQFLGDLLATIIEDCWSEHEADMFAGFNAKSWQRIQDFGLWHMVIGRALGQTGLRAAGTKFLTGEADISKLAEKLRRQRSSYHARIDENLVIESYWRWWMFSGEMAQIWPGAKTIGIIRDPKSWISSWLAHDKSHSGTPWTYYFPPGPITPARIGDAEWTKRWNRLSPVGRLAWEWREIYRRIDAAAQSADNTMIFRFEDLFDRETGAMERLVTFASSHGGRQYHTGNVDDIMPSVRNASGNRKDAWKSWSSQDKAIVDELCGPWMDKYGYARMAIASPVRESSLAQ